MQIFQKSSGDGPLSTKRKIFCPKLKKQDVELAEKAFGQLKNPKWEENCT